MNFSVLLSVYKRENPDFLSAALDSVFAQTLPATEVVLVKDGPLTPALDAVLTRFTTEHPNMKVLGLPTNRGLGFALNFGLDHCSHDIVARMDTDDIAEPQRFAKQVREFINDPKLALVGSSVAEFDTDPAHIERIRIVPVSHEQILRTFASRCPINHPSVVFRKSAVLQAGGYNSDFMQEDYYLWGRMLSLGQVFKNLDEPLVRMRCGSGLYGRRGGVRYAISEIKLQARFRHLGLISYSQLIANSAIRFAVRILHERVRRFIYMSLLRTPVAR